ncbi:MAG: DUF2264 domain-containing protein [Chloroflexota bacterium]
MGVERDSSAPYTGWTRRDWVALLARLTDGFVRAIPGGGSPAAARLPGAPPGNQVPSIEGFARMSVAWGAWLHEPSNGVLRHARRRHDVATLLARGLADATDPRNPAWWGPIGDRDQRIVEAAEISTALWLGGPRLRAALAAVDPAALDRVLDWLALVDGRDVWPDNWVLFPVLSAAVRRAAGRDIADAAIDDAIDWMTSRHVGDGWYSDGAGHALDLYTGWAIHWHLLWWAAIDGARRPARRAAVVRAARAWLAGTAALFAADGAFPTFGRSLGYRFAVVAPFAQAALLGIDPLPAGVARRLSSAAIRRAVEGGAIGPATDWFRVGVGAERPSVVEGYVSAGASAWAAHAFVALAMPSDHRFWAAREAPLPADTGRPGRHAAAGAGLLASWAPSGETTLHNARSGHPPDIADHDYAASYGKLAYRSAFPFDVPVGVGAAAGADNALVAIDDGADAACSVAHRNETDTGSAGPGWIHARYRLPTQPATTVSTIVLLAGEVEIRVSAVDSGTAVRIREGSAPLGLNGDAASRATCDEATGTVVLSDGPRVVAIRRLLGYDRVGTDGSGPDRSNLIHDRSEHGLVEESVASDKRRLVAAVTVAGVAIDDAASLLKGVDLTVGRGDVVAVSWPGGAASLAPRRAPSAVHVGPWSFSGAGIRVAVAATDGSSFRGERISRIDGVVSAERPAILAVERVDDRVEVVTETGLRFDPEWAGSDLVRVSWRLGVGDWEGNVPLAEPNVVPGDFVRRLARRLGTRLVALRLEPAP